jgi:hypothetical protein
MELVPFLLFMELSINHPGERKRVEKTVSETVFYHTLRDKRLGVFSKIDLSIATPNPRS